MVHAPVVRRDAALTYGAGATGRPRLCESRRVKSDKCLKTQGRVTGNGQTAAKVGSKGNVLRLTHLKSYDATGKVLTENGPRTDVTDVTTYTYYSCTTGSQCGQINTITNALGHVSTVNSYNTRAQPTQITDANGLVTTLGYDTRMRLKDRCVGSTLPGCPGGELTHLDYWPTGLLKKVINPDGSFIEYSYDAAHRLTQIKDGALNKMVYFDELRRMHRQFRREIGPPR